MPSVGFKARTLHYRRALWAHDKNIGSLEAKVRSALRRCPSTETTRVPLRGGVAEVCHRKLGRNARLHVAAYTPDEEASLVPLTSGVEENDLEVLDAPEGTEFMDGDLMFRVNGDSVIMCPSGVHPNLCARYLQGLFATAGLAEDSLAFELVAIADVNKVQLIERHGVKSVELDVAMYQESVSAIQDRRERGRLERHLTGPLRDILGLIFDADPTLDELVSAENLQAKLVLSFDRRRRGRLAQESVKDLAQRIVDEGMPDDLGFTINTPAGRITSDKLALRKEVELPIFGKTVSHEAAWREVDIYFEELLATHALEV